VDFGFCCVVSFCAWFARGAGLAPSEFGRNAARRAGLPPSSPDSLDAGCLSLLTGALTHPGYGKRNFGEAANVALLAKSSAIRPAEIA
jgi:hypothetical protein